MKMLVSIGGLLMALAMAAIGGASVIDAPHNETNGISCTTCHTYSLWWQYSPASATSNPDKTTVVVALCSTCHGAGGTAPQVLTHSSATIGSTTYGTWSRGCTDCHNPHYQGQLAWIGTTPSPYLVTGSIASVTYDSVAKQSTITYAGATSNVNWPVTAWGNKSLANPNRGLILVQDETLAANTYPIVSATATQIIVKGQIDPNSVNTAYINPTTNVQNAPTCNTFGLIYGQLISNSINSHAVKFFDPNGGFVDVSGSSTPTGVCQVCHTTTLHFKNDGVLPSGTDSHVGRETMNCTTCHQHASGFKGSGHDSTSFAWAGTCRTCHDPNNTVTNIVTQIHLGNCGLCHVNPAGGGPRQVGPPINGVVVGSALSTATLTITNASTCVDCHITALSLTGGIIHHKSPGGYAVAGNCTYCHDNAFGKLPADHSSHIAASAGFLPCHAANVGTTLGAPVSATDPKTHTACTVCHNTDGTIKAAYGYAVAMPATGGQCTDCHGAFFPNHVNVDHTAYVALNSNCALCHTGTAGTTAGVPVSATDPKLHKGCNACHDINAGTLLTVMAPGGTANISPGDCVNCHGQFFYNHTGINHSTYVIKNTLTTPPTSNCTGCHTATTAPFVGTGEVHSPKGCATCHNPDGSLAGDATGRTTGNECNTCHSTYFPGHLTHSTTNHDTATRTFAMRSTDLSYGQACNGCHRRGGPSSSNPLFTNTWGGTDGIYALHQLGCTECHDSTRTVNLKPGYATVQAIIMDPNLTAVGCLDCHQDRANPHSHPATDFVWGGVCNQCHSGTDIVLDVHGDNCGLCHVNPLGGGARRAGVKGDATLAGTANTASCIVCHDPTKFPTGGIHHDSNSAVNNNCVRCHDGLTFPSHAAPDHSTFVVNVAPCSNCHVATAGSISGTPISTTDPMIHNACRTCHTFDANLKGILANFTNARGVNGTGSLPAGGGACTVCHTQTPVSAFHHDDNRMLVGQCEYCHTDPRPITSGQPAPGDNLNGTLTGVGSNVPKHLACEECHVRWSGTAGNYTMTINKYTRTNYTDQSTPWASATVHTLTGLTSNQINNYGICLGCHNGTTTVGGVVAPNVQVWHARPDRFGGSNWILGVPISRPSILGTARCLSGGDQAHYAPGRSSSGIGNLNFWYVSYHSTPRASIGPCNSSDLNVYNTPKTATPYIKAQVPWNMPHSQDSVQWQTGLNYSVPVFPQVTQATGASYPKPDYISIQGAFYDGTNITVTATHTLGACNTLTAAYGGTTAAMSGTGICTAALAGSSYPTSGTTVNVTSSNTPSQAATGYQIVDTTTGNAGRISLAAATYSVLETAGTATITVNRISGYLGAASVSYATSDGTGLAGTNYLATSGTLTWTAGDPNPKTFTIGILNDNLAAGNKTVNITLSNVTGAILNDSVSAVLTIVDVPPNQPPVAANDSYSVVTGSTTTLSVLANDSDPNNDSLTITGLTTPTGGTASIMSGNNQIQYVAPTAAGTYTFNYTISDGNGGTATATVTMNVIAPVTVINQWAAGAPVIVGQQQIPYSQNFTVGSGSNRLMLVVVFFDYVSAVGPSTMTVTYGNSTLTQIVDTYNPNDTGTPIKSLWIGYLNEAGIAAHGTTDTINVTCTGTYPNSIKIDAAAYANVNQVNPFSGGGAGSKRSAMPHYSGVVTTVGGYAMYAIIDSTSVNSSLSPTMLSVPNGYTQHFQTYDQDTYFGYYRFVTAIGSKAVTSASTDGYVFDVTNGAQTTAQEWSVVSMALAPN